MPFNMLKKQNNSPFSHLCGQAQAKKLLEHSLSSGRVAHGYLFKGPEGVGKKLFASAMAQAISCTVSGPVSSCGDCLSCKKILSGSHPDFVIETPEKGAIKIAKVREVCRSLSYPPYESDKRVVVLEDIHTMRQEAANCLLKTLEEPPDDNVLILTTEASRSILATISSRCQIIPFFPLSEKDTVEILMGKEHGMGRQDATILARLSEGSPGRALILHKNEMVNTWRHVTTILSNPQYREDKYTGFILQLAGQMAMLKENLVPMLSLLRIWLRDLLLDKSITGQHNEIVGEGRGGQQKLSTAIILGKMKAIDRAEQQLARNCNRALVCEILLFRLQ